METKPLLYGLIGFFIGGFTVALAATTFDKPQEQSRNESMTSMASSLQGKMGDDFDRAFIEGMIVHHEDAIEMARLSNENAKHDEIQRLSEAIIVTQQKEIDQMNQWQVDWGYGARSSNEESMTH